MKNQSIKTKALALLLAALLVLPVLNINAAEATSESVNSTYHTYFNDVYKDLDDEDHVFRSLTYHELDFLLDRDGTYVVLFGGAWNEDTQAVISDINEVAKEYGIPAIYNFDTRLDGKTVEIADSSNSPYSRRYVDLVNKYLTNLDAHSNGSDIVSYTHEITTGRAPNQVTNTFEGTAKKIETPFLFVYNKNHKDENNNSAPIISSLEKTDEADAYKAELKAVFDAIPEKADILETSDYIKSSYNEFAGTTIFDESDGDIVIDPVTYDELTHILESEGNYVFMFGCSWCPNTRAIAKLVNQYAKKYNIDKVYNWDTKLDGGIGGTPDVAAGTDNANFFQIRTTGHPYANLYVDLVNNYFSNIETLYAKADNNVSYTDSKGNEIVANKLQVPYVFIYNKDHKDADGNSAPIVGHVELMYTWTNIQPDYERDGKIGVNYNNYTAALDDLFPVLHGALPQEAPTGLAGSVPTSSTSKDGQITGTSPELEYKRAEAAEYVPVQGESITDLGQGTYYVRYAAKDGFKASPAAIIDLNLEQAAPTGLAGAAPTTSANDSGQITGTTTGLEYKLSGDTKYVAATAPSIEGLAAGTYNVRYAAKYGYNPSAAIDVVVPAFTFADVSPTDWHYDAVSYLAAKGITNGTDDYHFSPNAKVTRGQFIVLLSKAFGIEPDANGGDNFADAGNTYYTNYLAAAKRLGIANGVGDNTFAPDKEITRQDLFTVLYRFLQEQGKLPQAKTDVAVSSFSDAEQIASYAQEAFKSLVEGGVIEGSNSKLSPKDETTRAEVAQVLYNLLSK